MEFRVLGIEHKDLIIEFEKNQFSPELSDLERDLKVWESRWRPEQLDFYLNLGWSFGVWESFDEISARSQNLIGYFLAQPILFFEGITQTLWIEHLSCKNEKIQMELVELAYKYGRDKHLQRVLFSQAHLYQNALDPLKFQDWGQNIVQVKTTKY